MQLSFENKINKGNDKSKTFSYIEKGIKAQGHTPIYKMHKYFARRPQNVFRGLIESYTEKNDVILDLFLGGGVTLIEGLATKRRVIGYDVNPMACMVSKNQVSPVQLEEFDIVAKSILDDVRSYTEKLCGTSCRGCGEETPFRWVEMAYLVDCASCGKKTSIRNENKLSKDGKPVNGRYCCQHCNEVFKSSDALRIDEEFISVRIKCDGCGFHDSVDPNEKDIKKYKDIKSSFGKRIQKENLWYPLDKIPDDWDRQKEDALKRKGFFTFSDLFTKRNLLITAHFLKLVRNQKELVSNDMYELLVFWFSATLRYTNNLNFSTSAWMGGRPVAWAKHAYWTPNQFVEVNPVEYLEKRLTAIKSGLKYKESHLQNDYSSGSAADVLKGSASFSINCKSSAETGLPAESIDAIVTDPPYGSNVQYGELCSFWLVWLRDELKTYEKYEYLDDEVIVHRKLPRAGKGKDFEFYYDGLKRIYSEGYRVLKPNGVLVFTFNNKELKTWFAVIKAALDSGFYLSPNGVIYQEPIEIYKDTAHHRYDGALQGDFIYTFRKTDILQNEVLDGGFFDLGLEEAVEEILLNDKNELISRFDSEREVYNYLLEKLTPWLVNKAGDFGEFQELIASNNGKDLESIVKRDYVPLLERGELQ